MTVFCHHGVVYADPHNNGPMAAQCSLPQRHQRRPHRASGRSLSVGVSCHSAVCSPAAAPVPRGRWRAPSPVPPRWWRAGRARLSRPLVRRPRAALALRGFAAAPSPARLVARGGGRALPPLAAAPGVVPWGVRLAGCRARGWRLGPARPALGSPGQLPWGLWSWLGRGRRYRRLGRSPAAPRLWSRAVGLAVGRCWQRLVRRLSRGHSSWGRWGPGGLVWRGRAAAAARRVRWRPASRSGSPGCPRAAVAARPGGAQSGGRGPRAWGRRPAAAARRRPGRGVGGGARAGVAARRCAGGQARQRGARGAGRAVRRRRSIRAPKKRENKRRCRS